MESKIKVGKIHVLWFILSVALLLFILFQENYLGNLERGEYWWKIVVHEFVLAFIIFGIPVLYVLAREKFRVRHLLRNLHKLLTPEKLLR